MACETLYNVNFCRICQTPSSSLTDISEKSDEGRSYWDTLKYLFEDIVWVEDTFKSLACQVCLKTINDVAAFKTLCLETNYQRLCLQLRLKNCKVVKVRKVLNNAGETKIMMDGVCKIDVARDLLKEKIKLPSDQGKLNVFSSSIDVSTNNDVTDVSEGIDWDKVKIKQESVDLDEINCKNDFLLRQTVVIKEELTGDRENFEVTDSSSPKVINNPKIDSNVETNDISPWPTVWLKEDPTTANNFINEPSKILQETSDFQNILPNNEKTTIKPKRKRKDNLSETIRQQNDNCEVSFSEYNYLTSNHRYKCSICHEHFDNIDALDRHLFAHNGTRMHTCGACGRMYVTRSDLLVHAKIHSEAKYECRICPNKRFKTLDSLRNHNIMLMHVGHSKIKLDKAKRLHQKVENVALDRLGDENVVGRSEKNYKCALCNVTFYKRRTFDVHCRRHRYKCSLCDQRFMKRFYIRVHLKVKHKIDVDENEAQRFYDEIKDCTE